MRIISGQNRGAVIIAPSNLPVRPTTDRSKESLFNIIETRFNIDELNVLDLFAGTGNISYEFASRGANEIICVDSFGDCLKFIQSVKVKHNFSAIQTIKSDVFLYLKKCTQQFNIIFADAPYALDKINQIPGLVQQKKLLKENGWLIIEHVSRLNLSAEPNFFDSRKYGQSTFSFFKNQLNHE